jgi:hypothetical protein
MPTVIQCLQRHSREGGNPLLENRKSQNSQWIPAFAGMTAGKHRHPSLRSNPKNIKKSKTTNSTLCAVF